MEEMSPAVAVPFGVGNSVCDNSTIATNHMDITRLKLMTDAAGLLSDSGPEVSKEKLECGEEDCDCSGLEIEVTVVAGSDKKEDTGGPSPLSDMISQNNSNWVSGDDSIARESEEEDCISVEGDQILDGSVASEGSSIEDFFGFEAISEVGTLSSVDIEKSICSVDVIAKITRLGESNVDTDIVSDPLAVAVDFEEEIGDGSQSKPSEVVLQLPVEKGAVARSVFEVDFVPLWGFTSVCGRRPEMEDAVATVPHFLKIPIQMLVGDRVLDGMSKYLNQQTVHFFGVYDGHGGSQVLSLLFPVGFVFLVRFIICVIQIMSLTLYGSLSHGLAFLHSGCKLLL